MASVDDLPLRQAEVSEILDIALPQLGKDKVLNNSPVQEVIYKEELLIDSGANDCITYIFRLLDIITSAFVSMRLADDRNVHDSNHKRIL